VVSAAIHLMSAILTWRQRGWRIEVEEDADGVGP
jgi:hypothetical protein